MERPMMERPDIEFVPSDAEAGMETAEAPSLDRLLLITDTDGLARMGLGLIEAFAHAKGRVLWH